MASVSPLTVRKLADENREFAGLRIEGETPEHVRVPTSFVSRGRAEGWIETEGGDEPVVRPGGPPNDRWRADKVHIFNHYDTITLKTVDGDVRYRVVHQPDKYVDTQQTVDTPKGPVATSGPGPEDDEPVTDEHYVAGNTRVDYFYDLKRED